MLRTLLAATLAAALTSGPSPQEPAPAPDPYPAVRNATVLRFCALEGELQADSLRNVLLELSTPGAKGEIVAGPSTSSTRPDKHFVALEIPAALAPKELGKALKKSGLRMQELEWTLFRGAPDEPNSILGYSARDCVIGMASEIRWFEFEDGASAFFCLPGKLSAEELADRYRNLYQPFGGGELGELARDTFTWTLAEPIEEAAARRAEKAIAKLGGVLEAQLDLGARTLRVTVALAGLSSSAPPAASSAKSRASSELFPRFDTNPVLAALEEQHLAPAPEVVEAGAGD